MGRMLHVPMIRAVAQAALEQNMLSAFDYEGAMQWIDRLERQSRPQTDDQAIRMASEIMIRRLRQSVSAY